MSFPSTAAGPPLATATVNTAVLGSHVRDLDGYGLRPVRPERNSNGDSSVADSTSQRLDPVEALAAEPSRVGDRHDGHRCVGSPQREHERAEWDSPRHRCRGAGPHRSGGARRRARRPRARPTRAACTGPGSRGGGARRRAARRPRRSGAGCGSIRPSRCRSSHRAARRPSRPPTRRSWARRPSRAARPRPDGRPVPATRASRSTSEQFGTAAGCAPSPRGRCSST